MGAAALAGPTVGFFPDASAVERFGGETTVFEPQIEASRREALYAGWKRAVERSRGSAEDA